MPKLVFRRDEIEKKKKKNMWRYFQNDHVRLLISTNVSSILFLQKTRYVFQINFERIMFDK